MSEIKPSERALFAFLPLLMCCLCAQAQSSGGTVNDDTRLEEILVTAERRETDLQETPLAVTTFNQQALDDLNIQDLSDFQSFVPSLIFSQDNSEFKVLIRGVGSDDVGTNSQPGVALHLDGMFIGRASGFNAATYDIDRIEVLRGPQGTLYGRNSTGGAINVISQAPDYELSSLGDVRFGSYDEVRFRGALNVPLIEDKLAARITAVSEDRDGYEKNLYPGGADGADADDTYWRTQLLFEPVDTLSVMFRASQYESRGVGPGRKRLPTPTDSQSGAATEITEDADLHTVWKDTTEFQTVDLDLYSIEADWELSFATLTALASYAETDFEWLADGDQTRGTVNDLPDGLDFVLGAPIGSEQDLAEMRLTSLPSGPFEWQVGVFYFNEETSTDFSLTNDQPGYGIFIGQVSNVAVVSNWDINTTSYAGFGQGSYSFGENDKFKLTVGGRYTHDSSDGEIYDTVTTTIPPPGLNQLTEETLHETWSKATWRLGFDWQLSDDSLLYASISSGYRSGGFNFQADDPDTAIYDPEDLIAYEVGSKNRFLDDRLQLNLAAFYYDYKNFQTFQIINTALFIENAGEVSNYGIEAELQALVTNAFEIDAHISYQHGRIEQFLSLDPLFPYGPDGSFNTGDEKYDLKGKHLPNNPDFSGHLGAQYTWDINGLGSLTLRGQTYYQNETYSRAFNLDVGKQDSYTKSKIQLRFDEDEEGWYLMAGVDNIEDEDVKANIAITGTGRILANIGPPRTWYVGLGFQM